MAADWMTANDTDRMKKRQQDAINGTTDDSQAVYAPRKQIATPGISYPSAPAPAAAPSGDSVAPTSIDGVTPWPLSAPTAPDPNAAYNPATGQVIGTRRSLNPASGVAPNDPNPASVAAAPSRAPASAAPGNSLAYRPTSVAGIFAVKGPDGSTTFTDVPGGSFEQSQGSSAGGGVHGAQSGQGNFAAGDLQRNAPGLRYIRPNGDGIAVGGGAAPGTTPWLNSVNAAQVQRADESDQQFGSRIAANKQAGLNYRTHSGQFALPAQSFDPSVIGPDAAYGRNGMVGGGGQPGQSGIPGQPGLTQADIMEKLAKVGQINTESGLAVANAANDRQKQARDFDQSKYDEYMAGYKDRKDLSQEDKMRAAAIHTHNDLTQTFPDVESEAFTNSNKGRQFLADELKARTAVNGELPSRGESDLSDYGVRNLGTLGAAFGHPAEIVRGLEYRKDGSVVPSKDAQSSAGTMFTNHTALGDEIFGRNGERAGNFLPAIQRARALRLKKLGESSK